MYVDDSERNWNIFEVLIQGRQSLENKCKWLYHISNGFSFSFVDFNEFSKKKILDLRCIIFAMAVPRYTSGAECKNACIITSCHQIVL